MVGVHLHMCGRSKIVCTVLCVSCTPQSFRRVYKQGLCVVLVSGSCLVVVNQTRLHTSRHKNTKT